MKSRFWRVVLALLAFQVVFLGVYILAAQFNLYYHFNRFVSELFGLRPSWSGRRYLLVRTVATFLISVPAMALAALIFERLAPRAHADGELHCPQCGYILKGLKEPRCPECGRPI